MRTIKKIAILLMTIAILIATSCGTKGKKELKKAEGVSLSRIEVSITGMSCTGCEQTIQTNVAKIEGVYNVKAAFTTGKAVVEFNPELADTSKIRTAIVASGYRVTGFGQVTPADTIVR